MAAVSSAAQFDESFELLLDEVRPGRALRKQGVAESHVDALAELAGAWPPILVWGPDNQIIDGAHRVAAARRLGWCTISAVRFVGSDDEAFVESVHRNVTQGLPLTVNERVSASRELLRRHPEWSDRWISGVCALSAKTVARLRRDLCGSGPDHGGFEVRVGRDGRSRPVAGGAVRGRIIEALTERPDGSLRSIAAEVGASPETVRSVRRNLARQDDTGVAARVPGQEQMGATSTMAFRLHSLLPPNHLAWSEDQALTSTERGQDFTEWFGQSSVADEWYRYLDAVPLSRIYEVADEARRRANAWSSFAQTLEGRVKTRRSMRA
jgi:ParB-like chromosome segregation protein Spo0J